MQFLDQEWKANTLRAVSQCSQVFTRLTGKIELMAMRKWWSVHMLTLCILGNFLFFSLSADFFLYTIKPVLREHSKIYKIKILMTNGS